MSTDLVDPDDELVSRVRGGGSEAYDLLFERHAARARRVARAALDDPADTDDVVSETFAAVFGALQRGNGPTEGFEGYLVSAVRHEAYRANRRRTRQRPLGDRGDEPAADPFAGREDEAILRVAFDSLPPVSREVLWSTEVEGRSHADIARTVGSTRQAIAARAARARDALGSAYLAGHLDLAFDEPPVTAKCTEVQRQLVDLVRGHASRRRRRVLEGHLAECARCRAGRDRLASFNERLRTAPFMAAAVGVSKLVTVAGPVSLLARLGVAPLLAGAVAATTLGATVAFLAPTLGDAAGSAEQIAPASTGSAGSTQEHSARPATTPEGLAAPESAAGIITGAATMASADQVAGTSTTIATAALPAMTPSSPPTTAAAISLPGITLPGVTVPALTVAPLAVPPLSVPPVTVLPAVTVPAVTVPAVTVPPLTVPSLTVPSISTPIITTPPITTPAITTPAITTPPITTPVITTPPITTPAITVPPIIP